MSGVLRSSSRLLRQVLSTVLLFAGLGAAYAANDPYEPNVVMPSGRLQGQAIDARRRRPVTILSPDLAAQYGAQPGDLVFANFFAEDRYWIARLPKDAVDQVILQMEKFNPDKLLHFPPHPQFRFVLKPGKELMLYPQAGKRLPKTPSVNDLVITAWSASVKGQEFSIPKSFRGDYVRYVRVLSADEAFQTGVIKAKHEIQQVALRLDDSKKSELLNEAIRLSDQQGFNRPFSLFNSNCRTFALCDLLKPVLNEELGDSTPPAFAYPGRLKSYLSSHSLVDPATQGALPNWEQQWSSRLPPPKKKVLIFSVTNGGGHTTSSEAIKARLLAIDPKIEVVIKDVNDFTPLKAGPVVRKSFDLIYRKKPELWAKFRESQLSAAEHATSAADMPSFLSEKALLDYLKDIQPDVIVSTYNGVISTLAKLRRDGLIKPENFKIGWLSENFTDENWYFQKAKAIDMTFSPHSEITRSWLEQGLPKSQVETTGLPLNPKMFQDFSEDNRLRFLAKALVTPDRTNDPDFAGIWVNGRLQTPTTDHPVQIDPKIKTVFLSSGKSGVGDYKTIVTDLIQNAQERGMRLQIIAACGTNAKNYTDLTRMQVPEGITLAVSKTLDNDKMVNYTRAADLIIGKSGSQGPSEFFLSGTPRVLIDVVGAQETTNGRFFQQQGLAELVPVDEQDKVADIGFELLENPEKLKKMQAADLTFRQDINYGIIDNWIMENLTDAARAKRLPISGNISKVANVKSNLSTVSRMLLGGGKSGAICVENYLKKRFFNQPVSVP